MLQDDLKRQILALLNQGPGSFTGKFIEGLDELQKIASDLRAGQPIDAAKAAGVITAVQKGIEEYKTHISQYYGTSPPAEIQAILRDLATLKASLEAPKNCFASNIPANASGSGKNEVIRLFSFADCSSFAVALDNTKTGVEDAVEALTILETPLSAETNANAVFSCNGGKKATFNFDSGSTTSQSTGINPPIWTINGSQYYCYWNANLTEVEGFFEKSGVDGLKNAGKKITSLSLSALNKFTAYAVVSIEANSSDCILKANDFDPTQKGEYFSEAGWLKLQQKLQKQGADATEIHVLDCTQNPPKLIKAIGKNTLSDASQNKNIIIELCWDGTKYTINHDFKDGALQPKSGYTGTAEEVEAASDAVANRVKENGMPAGSSGDGELEYTGLGFLEAVIEVKEATLTLCNEAKVPEKYWQSGQESPVKAPTLSGVGDGAIDELKSIPELVGFGLQIATEPEVAKGMWTQMKSLTPSKVKKMLIGAGSDKLAKYTVGGNTMKHEVGKDGVAIAMFVFGGVTKIKDGAELIDDLGDAVVSKLDDVAEESLEELSESISELGGKSFNKALKEAEFDNFVVESYSSTVADAAKSKGRKLTWEEVKALFKRGNDFNGKAKNVYDYNEIVLGTKKRLDTYIPGQKIISRKATDIDNITEQTWRNYCYELVTKYKVGTPVNSNKLPLEPPLSGKYYLEIPASNQSASKLARFKAIAAEYGTDNGGIEIIFLNE